MFPKTPSWARTDTAPRCACISVYIGIFSFPLPANLECHSCVKELVNLIISGRAASNVFDGDNQLDPQTILKGIKKQCRVRIDQETSGAAIRFSDLFFPWTLSDQ